MWGHANQQVLNLTPLNPAPARCHKRKRKLRCSFRNAALQKLHCNIPFSAVRKSFGPKAALQQMKNCTATSKKLRCRKVALSCRFPAGFTPPRLGTHVSDLLSQRSGEGVVRRNGCPKRCFWRVRFFSAPLRLKVFRTFQVFKEKILRAQRRNGLSKNTLLDNRFYARPLRSFGVP